MIANRRVLRHHINASFVEGYDNSECFILTQDPMESTQRDFWIAILRLLEHNIVVIVMLSEMGDRRFGHFLLPAENPDGANICRQRESGPSLTMAQRLVHRSGSISAEQKQTI